MTKHDRAKMRARLLRLFPDFRSCGGAFEEIYEACVSEVDRAVRSERKKLRDDEEQRLARLRQIDDELVDWLKRVGVSKT